MKPRAGPDHHLITLESLAPMHPQRRKGKQVVVEDIWAELAFYSQAGAKALIDRESLIPVSHEVLNEARKHYQPIRFDRGALTAPPTERDDSMSAALKEVARRQERYRGSAAWGWWCRFGISHLADYVLASVQMLDRLRGRWPEGLAMPEPDWLDEFRRVALQIDDLDRIEDVLILRLLRREE